MEPLIFNSAFRIPHSALVWVAAGVLLLDQATKLWVRRAFELNSARPVTFFFSLTHVRNTGAAFGMMQDSNLFFIIVTVAILVLLFAMRRRFLEQGPAAALGLALLWGGALGNLADRIALGSVTDFLHFHWHGRSWPDFNVADSAICAGVFLLVLDGFLSKEDRPGPGTADRPAA